jgi:predicted Zn-dependent peptidase
MEQLDDIKKVIEFDGIEVYSLKNNKFKTSSINVFFVDNLNKENVTKNALIPQVLKRGSNSYNDIRKINLKLDELYGSSFECGVGKKGEFQIIQFYIDYISKSYLDGEEETYDKVLEFLFEILLNPKMDDGGFDRNFIKSEALNIIKRIDSRKNDKISYSLERCMEEMCKDEAYSINEYGFKDDLENINQKELYKHYRKYFLQRMPMKVFISGEFDDNDIEKLVNKLKFIKRKNLVKLELKDNNKKNHKTNNFVEKMDVTQGKLVLGFRTNTNFKDDMYKSLVVYNSILGGGVHSKLFLNVREKESLAYYASSSLNKFKGLQFITSGIEINNKDKALDIILKQIDEIKNGNISDYEYDTAQSSIETAYNYLSDTQLSKVDFYLGQILLNIDDKISDILEGFKTVKKEDIKEVAKKVELDTVYFLT